MIGGMLRVLIVGLVLLVAAMVMMPRPDRVRAPGPDPETDPEVATYLPTSLALPDVRLTDDSGRAFDLESLRGRYSLLFFGFTHCPDVCPLTLQVLARVHEQLDGNGSAAAPDVVFVSVDPHRDTPERIRAYVDNFDPRFVGITGPDQALEPLLETLGVTVERHEHEGESYNVVHNSTIYFVSPEAELIAVSSAPHDPRVIAADFRKIRQRHEASRRTPAS